MACAAGANSAPIPPLKAAPQTSKATWNRVNSEETSKDKATAPIASARDMSVATRIPRRECRSALGCGDVEGLVPEQADQLSLPEQREVPVERPAHDPAAPSPRS